MSRRSPKRDAPKAKEETADDKKLVRSDVMFGKLLWHPTIDQDTIEVGYTDRFIGLKWVALRKWHQGGKNDFDSIPWHRVQQYRASGVVFWDRETRLDLTKELFNGTLEAAPSAGPKVASSGASKGRISFPHTKSTYLSAFNPDTGVWEPQEFSRTEPADDQPAGAKLRMASWNVLFGKYFEDAFVLRGAQRYDRLLGVVAQAGVDVVCLQECDSVFTEHLLQHAGVRQNYFLTDHTAVKGGSDSILMVSKTSAASVKCAKHYSFNPNVHAVLLDMKLEGVPVSVVGLHLTSDMAAQAQEKRAKQISGMMDLVRKVPNAFLIGDYNFGEGPEDDATDWGNFQDAFLVKHGRGGAVDTFTPERNPLASINSRSGLSRRLDRVMFRAADVAVESIDVIGDSVSSWVQPHDSAQFATKGHTDVAPGADVEQVQVIVRGPQCSGKSVLSQRLCTAVDGAFVSMDAKSTTRNFLTRLSAAVKGGSRCIVADAAHMSVEELQTTVNVLRSSGKAGLVVLVDVQTPQECCADRLRTRDSELGEKADWLLGATMHAHQMSLRAHGVDDTGGLPHVDLHTTVSGCASCEEQMTRLVGEVNAAIVGRVGAHSGAASFFATPNAFDKAPPACVAGPLLPLLPQSDHYGLLLQVAVCAEQADDGLVWGREGNMVEGARAAPLPAYTGGYHRTCALALVVSEAVAARRLRGISGTYLKSAKHWPVHMNIMWPFVEKEAWPEARLLLEEAVREADMAPFRLNLSRIHTKKDKERGRVIMYLAPGDEDDCFIRRLRKSVKTRFPNEEERDFEAHLSLGVTTAKEADAVLADFKKSLAGRADSEGAMVTGVQYLCKNGATGMMDVVDEVAFPACSSDVDVLSNLWTHEPEATLAAVSTPRWLLEPHPLGGRRQLDTYTPQDALETFFLHLTAKLVKSQGQAKVAQLLDTAPTHICQKGGRYYIPDGYVDEYLRYWRASFEGGADFYMEEVRGAVFRCYVDIDMLSLEEVPFDLMGSGWLDGILGFAAEFFEKRSLAAVVMDCHGAWASVPRPDVRFKSGFRIYFLDMYVNFQTYKRFVSGLQERFMQEVKTYPGMPEGGLEEVIDMHSVDWERGRLVGTKKRRKNIARVYRLLAAVAYTAGREAPVSEAASLSAFLKANPEELLYATTLRMWQTPSFAHSPETLVPHTLQQYWRAIVPEYGATSAFTQLDLLHLKAAPFNAAAQASHLDANTVVVGHDRPAGLSQYPFISLSSLYEDMFGVAYPEEEQRDIALVEQLTDALKSYRGDVSKQTLREADWRHLVCSARTY